MLPFIISLLLITSFSELIEVTIFSFDGVGNDDEKTNKSLIFIKNHMKKIQYIFKHIREWIQRENNLAFILNFLLTNNQNKNSL